MQQRSNQTGAVLDVLGIGFGPANLALAIALEERTPHLRAHFIESRAEACWQPGMMLPGADIQNHPLRDLVTPRNPRSHYTFTNFLHENGRLFEHLNLGMLFPLRSEYDQYIRWAAKHFDHVVDYGSPAVSIELEQTGGESVYAVQLETGKQFVARSLVVGVGRTPYVPRVFSLPVRDPRVCHLVEFLPALKRLERDITDRAPRIAVIGGSQSAVEILLHLARSYPLAHITSFSRRFGFRQKDTSPFTGEVYYPAFVDTFYSASQDTRRELADDLRLTNYSAADADVLDALYRELYEQRCRGRSNVELKPRTRITGTTADASGVQLSYTDAARAGTHEQCFDLVILATGFRDLGPGEHQERCPPILRRLHAGLRVDDQRCIVVERDYRVQWSRDVTGPPLFLNGLCESTHGFGDAGSFSLLSLRSATIADALARQLSTRRNSPLRAAANGRTPTQEIRV